MAPASIPPLVAQAEAALALCDDVTDVREAITCALDALRHGQAPEALEHLLSALLPLAAADSHLNALAGSVLGCRERTTRTALVRGLGALAERG